MNTRTKEQMTLYKHSTAWAATVALALLQAAAAQPIKAQQAAASAPSSTEPGAVTNSIGMRFVRVSASSFMMGAAEQDRQAGENEKPRQHVTISKPFHIAQHELTLAQWQAVMGGSPYVAPRAGPCCAARARLMVDSRA